MRWKSPRGGGAEPRDHPRRPGRRTQRIKARFLFVTQRIVEFRKRGPYGLHRAERGVEPLLHRLDPNGRRQYLVARAIDLEPFRRLYGCILQLVECSLLFRRGLDDRLGGWR